MSHCLTCLFADAPPPNANTVWLVLLALGTLVGNLATFGLWISSRRQQQTIVSPQPFLVAMEKEFAKLHTFEEAMKENKREHENLFSKIGGVERGASGRLEEQLKTMRSESREERGELHNKVNAARESIAGLESTTELQNQQLTSIQADIKRLLEKRS